MKTLDCQFHPDFNEKTNYIISQKTNINSMHAKINSDCPYYQRRSIFVFEVVYCFKELFLHVVYPCVLECLIGVNVINANVSLALVL